MTFSHTISRLKNKTSNQWLVLGILLVSFNLRPSITAVGPLIPYIREEMSISNGLAGFLTTLPLLSFAIFFPFLCCNRRLFWQSQSHFLGLVVLGIGSIIRVSAGPYALFVGTALTGIGIVICNVLLIPLVKARMPTKTGAVTGMYSTGMSLMAAIATALSVPLAIDLGWGWRGSLLFWSSLLFLALIVWWPQLKLSPKPKVKPEKQKNQFGAPDWPGRLLYLWVYNPFYSLPLSLGFLT